MAPNAKELTHDEVWDDSALIDSWNEALEEYKKYHSIHAKGGRLEDLDEEEFAQLQSQAVENPETPNGDQTEPAAQVGPGIASGAAAEHARHSDITAKTSRSDHGSVAAGAAGLGMPPQAFLGTDEGLKRLLMSWYYAGYYTGLYEGQQQTQTRQESDNSDQQA